MVLSMINNKDNRSYRLLDLYKRLQQGEVINKAETSRQYGISYKTVQRDLDELRTFLANEQTYAELTYDKNRNGYRLEQETIEALTPEEVFAICKILLESRPFPKNVINQILQKLIKQISSEKRSELERVILKEKHFYTPPQHGKNVITDLWKLVNSINQSRYISFEYRRLDGKEHLRRVKPVAIMFSEYYFYLIAYYADDSKDYPIVFRIDRMREIKLDKDHFVIPHKDKFKEGEFRQRVQFMYAGTLRRIRFTYSGISLEAIKDRLPTAKVLSQENGVYTIETESYGKGIEMWLRTQGDEVEIIEVEEL